MTPLDTITRSGEGRLQLVDTAFRGLLAVALYALFPAFSDIYRLWRRDAGIVAGGWPSGAVEYPPLIAALWEPLSWLPSARLAVIVNGLVMVAAAVGVTWVLQRSDRDGHSARPELWIASPVLLFLLPANWDVAIAFLVVVALLLLTSEISAGSGALLGLGAAAKVFPGAILLPVSPLIDGWRRRLLFLSAGGLSVATAYVIYWMARPEIWRFHLDNAASRDDFSNTIWGAVHGVLGVLGFDLGLDSINLSAVLALVVGLVGLTVWIALRRPTIAEAGALAVIVFLLTNKVFKPQYTLWIVPLMAMVGSSKRTTRTIELATLVEFVTIYFAVPAGVLFIATVARIGGLIVAAGEILRRYRG